MPRRVLLQRNELLANQEPGLSLRSLSATETSSEDKIRIDRLLRRPRSKDLIASVRELDAGGHVCNHEQVESMLGKLRNEFPEINVAEILLGIVAVCYLGKPYEVHTLDLNGGIIQHYRAGESLPGALDKARSLAIRGGYEYIEVYADCCRAISGNGSVSVIPG